MATSYQPPNIWAQMTYTPPRGPCSSRTSLVSTCACHRFMLHPLQATSSYACDGCGHHASFHRMESVEDEAVVARWRAAQAVNGRSEGANVNERRIERVDDEVQDALRRGGDVSGREGTKRRRLMNEPDGRDGAGEEAEVVDVDADTTESMRAFIRKKIKERGVGGRDVMRRNGNM